jgi:hypothetical protein
MRDTAGVISIEARPSCTFTSSDNDIAESSSQRS